MKFLCGRQFEDIIKKHASPKLLNGEWMENARAVSHIITFKTTDHMVNNLIDWNKVPDDPMFQLSFPQPDMLPKTVVDSIKELSKKHDPSTNEFKKGIFEIGKLMNPHCAAQHANKPKLVQEDGSIKKIDGLQHKYRETCLYFYKPAQHCFSNCTYCFRWPQLIGFEPFQNENPKELFDYLSMKKMLTDVLFTGGDPGTLNVKHWEKLLLPMIEGEYKDKLQHIVNLRIGTRALTFWPERFVSDPDSTELLKLFEKVNTQSNKQIQIMSHLSHFQELEPEITHQAIRNLRDAGCNIRSQSPIIKHINDDANIWSTKWTKEVSLGIIPYYMFVERDTGPKAYFEIPLVRALDMFNEAHANVSGLARTVRGPSMSCTPGKVRVTGVSEIGGEKVFTLQFLQGRNADWCKRLFYAKYDPQASWMDDLKPAFGEEKFFFEDELQEFLEEKKFH